MQTVPWEMLTCEIWSIVLMQMYNGDSPGNMDVSRCIVRAAGTCHNMLRAVFDLAALEWSQMHPYCSAMQRLHRKMFKKPFDKPHEQCVNLKHQSFLEHVDCFCKAKYIVMAPMEEDYFVIPKQFVDRLLMCVEVRAPTKPTPIANFKCIVCPQRLDCWYATNIPVLMQGFAAGKLSNLMELEITVTDADTESLKGLLNARLCSLSLRLTTVTEQGFEPVVPVLCGLKLRRLTLLWCDGVNDDEHRVPGWMHLFVGCVPSLSTLDWLRLQGYYNWQPETLAAFWNACVGGLPECRLLQLDGFIESAGLHGFADACRQSAFQTVQSLCLGYPSDGNYEYYNDWEWESTIWRSTGYEAMLEAVELLPSLTDFFFAGDEGSSPWFDGGNGGDAWKSILGDELYSDVLLRQELSLKE